MSYASRDFAGTSLCQAEDGTEITISTYYEGDARAILHQGCDMRRATWAAERAGFLLEGDARLYRPLEVLPIPEFVSGDPIS